MKHSKLNFKNHLFLILLFLTGISGLNAISTEVDMQIEQLVNETLKKSKIPGLSIVIIDADNNNVIFKNFGLSDTDSGEVVTADTLFEIGSNSKAFTALTLLSYVQKGLINLEDQVQDYLPWFQVTYKGEKTDIKIRDLLYHTSGIPFATIKDIHAGDNSDALETTVKSLIGTKLEFLPGEEYEYVTINYDILGLVITSVSGKTFEETVQQELLTPLNLNNTALSRKEVASNRKPIGYKWSFLHPIKYDAPFYRANVPAGYFISNAQDIAKWMKIQMEMSDTLNFDPEVIRTSHEPDRTVNPGVDGASYAGGWEVYQRGSGEISHGGNNPNFSSYIGFRSDDGVAVAVLANLNSAYTYWLGQNIINLLAGNKETGPPSDIYKSINQFSAIIIIFLLPLTSLIFFFTCKLLLEIIKRKRIFRSSLLKMISIFFSFCLFLAGFVFCLSRIPNALFWGVDWNFIQVWAPVTFIPALIQILVVVFLLSFYFCIIHLFPKENEKSLFSLILLSIISGLGNAFIIFMVNETLSRGGGFQGELFVYFLLGIVIYLLGQKLVRTKLIIIANNVVYEKRMEMIHKILGTSYQKMDDIEYGKIQAALNNDTEQVSEFSHIIITGATSLVTLLACFVYMGIISITGLIVTFTVIVLAAGLHFLIGRKANILWEETRDIQNVFFKFINDLTRGFKELTLHKGKNRDFNKDMSDSCLTYRDKRTRGDLKYVNANVIGELLFTFVIGVVAFIFPILFKNIKVELLRSYVFVLLYMTGPVHGILSSIPDIFKVRISWKRINTLIETLDHSEKHSIKPDDLAKNNKDLHIELKDIEFHYKQNDDSTFKVGPVNLSFKPGEITFITGGNGSGKSTLAKLITGLYSPDKGEIYINNQKVNSKELGQKYSTVFSDFHLFEKLYGIDHSRKKDAIKKHLSILQLTDKVSVNDGILSTLKLSTGQRKRLALLVSYLEDREVYLFDEWAADQDPEFRKFFYNDLLPELKKRGKCVIAITHDDRYFGLADNIVKMELGKIINGQKQS